MITSILDLDYFNHNKCYYSIECKADFLYMSTTSTVA